MKYAIIAAGEGSRLAREGIWEPKPLVEVGGERLLIGCFGFSQPIMPMKSL